MENNFKPEGYSSVSPYFIVEDSSRWMNLLSKVFDAESVRKFDNPDGSLMHGELRIDDSIIMFSEASEQYPANKFLMHVYVTDAKITYQKAIEAGCIGIKEPVQEEGDQDIRGQFRDFAGNEWAVGSQSETGDKEIGNGN